MLKHTEAYLNINQLLKFLRGHELCAICTLLDKELFLVKNTLHLFLKYVKKMVICNTNQFLHCNGWLELGLEACKV